MAAQIKVYLTPEEAERGTTRMIRPAGGRWVEVRIPPTGDDELLPVAGEFGEVRVHVTIVPQGIRGIEVRTGQTGWRGAPARLGIAVLVVLLGLIVALLVVRGCATVHPMLH